MSVCQRDVDRAARLVAARVGAGARHPVRVGYGLEHPDLDVVRTVTVPEDQDLTVLAEHVRGGGETLREVLVDQAAGVRRIQRLADEVVHGGVSQPDEGVRHDAQHIDQTRGLGLRRDGRRVGVRRARGVQRQARRSQRDESPLEIDAHSQSVH